MKPYTNHLNRGRSMRTQEKVNSSKQEYSPFSKGVPGDFSTTKVPKTLRIHATPSMGYHGIGHVLFSLLLLTLVACDTNDSTPCSDKNCSDYPSQTAAQIDFEQDPECRNDLDADDDGKACEQWFGEDNTRDDCPTTSNCGCSNKRKAECDSDCCQWIVGSGCRCS